MESSFSKQNWDVNYKRSARRPWSSYIFTIMHSTRLIYSIFRYCSSFLHPSFVYDTQNLFNLYIWICFLCWNKKRRKKKRNQIERYMYIQNAETKAERRCENKGETWRCMLKFIRSWETVTSFLDAIHNTVSYSQSTHAGWDFFFLFFSYNLLQIVWNITQNQNETVAKSFLQNNGCLK